MRSCAPHTRPVFQSITHTDDTTAQHASRNAAVPSHRVIAASTEIRLHTRAGLAQARAFEKDLADAEDLVFQSEQIDAADHKIPARKLGGDVTLTEQLRHHGEMLALYQRDLAPAAGVARTMIPVEPAVDLCVYLQQLAHGFSPDGAYTDPFDPPVSRESIGQAA
jgi:hypothetical protein